MNEQNVLLYRPIIVQMANCSVERRRQHRIKLPTIMSGIPQVSLRIVNEKQQLTNPSLPGVGSRGARPGVVVPVFCFTKDLDRNTQEVNTAFCDESNATLQYF
jgi:hypothetical protein